MDFDDFTFDKIKSKSKSKQAQIAKSFASVQ